MYSLSSETIIWVIDNLKNNKSENKTNKQIKKDKKEKETLYCLKFSELI
jgi:hypothetical protein